MALLALVALVSLAATVVRGAEAPSPNILFILADDQSFETVGARGLVDIDTPNLDRLSRTGTSFRRAYNMGSWSGAVCVASRTMLNTGRFLWRAHAVYDRSEGEREKGRFWSEHLRKAGYTTYMTGKWHLKASAEKAFDRTGHVRGGMPNQTEAGYDRPRPGEPDPWSPWDPEHGGFWAGGKHWSEVVADETIAFLADASGSDRPFFIYAAFNAPHDPRQSPKEYVEKYPLERVRVPASFLAGYPHKDAIGCGKTLRDERLGPFPRTEHAVKVHRGEYFAIISHMDAQIGRILDALEANASKRPTYIFFTADHGLAVGHHGLFGKQNQYDHSVRVPFIVVGPDVPAGKTIDTPIYLQDVMPTTLELAGIERPAHVEFKSLLPLVRGDGPRPYDAIYGAYLDLQRMVTAGDHKLILYPKASRYRLYDLASDPGELRDLAGDPASLPRVRALFAKLLELQVATGDELDLRATFPDLSE